MRRLALKIQDIVDFEITDDMLWESIDARKGLQKALINQQNLLEKADPLPISTTHEVFSNNLGALPLTTHELKEPIEALEILYREIKNKVDHGEGVVEKGAPRILSLLPPHSSDPRWEHMICELGIAPLASENNLFPIHGTRSLDLGQEKPKDPYEQLSQKLQISYYQNISSRGAIIIEACKRLNVDGVLARSHVGCRAPAAGTLIVKGAIESKLGIPVMLMERDDFDPRSYNDEYKRQIELFKDILNNSRKRKQS